MIDEQSPSHEIQKEQLLAKINAVLAELGSTAKWKKSPEWRREYSPLQNKTIVMVDDLKEVLAGFAPYLIVASNEKSSFIQHTDQELDQLVEEILKRNPDILISDFHLSGGIKGEQLMQALKQNNFSGQMIGCSSDTRSEAFFLRAGAVGVIDKGDGSPETSVTQLANIISVNHQ